MNTAGRVLVIHDKLVAEMRGQERAMAALWSNVFDIEETNPQSEDEIVVCLQALRSELDLLGSKLKSLGVTDQMIHPYLARLRKVASTANINSGMNNFKSEYASTDNRLFLLWADWTLRDQVEDVFSPDEMAVFQEELDALEKSLQTVDMPPFLHDFITRQITLIRSALKTYHIRGVTPIKEALRQVVGSCVVEASHIETESQSASNEVKGVMQRLGVFIQKTAEYADRFDKIHKAGVTVVGLAKTVGPILIGWAGKVGG